MPELSRPIGTVDALPAETPRWQAIERIARETARLFHFGEIRTPIFEHSEVFHRGVGEATDLVSKETYTFTDRGGRSITLRPEQTAGVARAVIENGLLNDPGSVVKVFYIGPNFRYEKPQKGRLRQHHQFGAEAFGVAAPEMDVQCILLQLEFYRRCGLRDLSLRVNSLGDRESKQRYRDELLRFLRPRSARLSPDSQRRLQANPLRILDSKDPRDIEACAGAPPAQQSLSEKSKAHFDAVCRLLVQAGVKFNLDGTLVRGFDYYTDTLWEVTADGLGSQNALGGGGRYDNLVESLGGRPTPGVGFGSGLERLLLALEAQAAALPLDSPKLVWLVWLGERAKLECQRLLQELRQADIPADMDFTGRNVKSQFKLAVREGANFCLTIGDSEIDSLTVMLKDLATQQQASVPRDQIVARLSRR